MGSVARLRCALLLATFSIVGCNDEGGSKGKTDDAAIPQEDAGAADSGEPAPGLSSCLDQPEGLDRPNNAKLPCTMLPPGLTLPATDGHNHSH